jgi:hypothetical protein
MFQKNWLYKGVALIVATAVWATTIYGRKDTLLLKTLELEFVMKPNFAITSTFDRTVQVKVAGPRSQLDKFAVSAQPIVINLANEPEGDRVVPIRPSDVGLPLGVRILSIYPTELKLSIKEISPAQ